MLQSNSKRICSDIIDKAKKDLNYNNNYNYYYDYSNKEYLRQNDDQ